FSGRVNLHLLPCAHAAGDAGARDDRAEASYGEDPVHGKPEDAPPRLFLYLVRLLPYQPLQGVDVLPRHGRDGDDGRALEEPALGQLFHLFRHELDHVIVHEVFLCDGHDAPLYTQKLADVHVLPGLGHDRLVGSDHEEHHVDAPCPRHHVLDEPLVAGHIDNAHEHVVPEAIEGKAQLDGDAPLLLFLEPVTVDAGEGLDEGRLPVIDMPGRSDDYSLHRVTSYYKGGKSERHRAFRLRAFDVTFRNSFCPVLLP